MHLDNMQICFNLFKINMINSYNEISLTSGTLATTSALLSSDILTSIIFQARELITARFYFCTEISTTFCKWCTCASEPKQRRRFLRRFVLSLQPLIATQNLYTSKQEVRRLAVSILPDRTSFSQNS